MIAFASDIKADKHTVQSMSLLFSFFILERLIKTPSPEHSSSPLTPLSMLRNTKLERLLCLVTVAKM